MIYSFPFYDTLIGVLATIAFAALSVYLLKRTVDPKYKVAAIIAALILGGVVTPCLALDRLKVDEFGITHKTGFWFSPTIRGIKYEDVRSICITTARDRKNREYEVWIITRKNGLTYEFDPGDLWEIYTIQLIKHLKSENIEVVNLNS